MEENQKQQGGKEEKKQDKKSDKDQEKRLWKIFWSTFYLSAFTFGGGYVIVSLMKKKFVDEYHWIEEEEMLDLVAIAQSAPGAIAGDGLLGGPGHSGLRRFLLAVFIGLFPKRDHGSCLPSSKSHSSCWSYRGESSGGETGTAHSTTAAFPKAGRSFRTSQGRTPAASPPSCRGWRQCCRRNPGEQKTAALQ